MDFELTENQRMMRDMTRDFAVREIAPLAHEMDVTGEVPDELLDKINREGIASLTDEERDFLKKASRDYRN